MRIVIVEDDREAKQRLEDCLHQYEAEYGVSFSIAWYANGFDFLEGWHQDADIIFMDVDMPGMNGIETAHRMREADANVVLIFVTNLAQYAIEGYAVDALDYVLKPVEYFALKLKIKKALRMVAACTEKVVPVPQDGQMHYLKSSEILYVEVEKHALTYHTLNGDFTCDGSLKNAEEVLEGADFYRCNYCSLVNLRHVSAVGSTEVQLGTHTLQISRNRRKGFLEKLTDYYRRGGRAQ